MSIGAWRARFEATPYVRRLGCSLEILEEERAELALPFREENSNPGGALHGGVLASLVAMAGGLAAESRLDAPERLESGVVDLSLHYLAAALSEPVRAEGRVTRRGREIVFAEATVRNADDRPLARGLVTTRAVDRERAERASRGDPEPARVDPAGFIEGPFDPGAMGRALAKAPFMGSLLCIEHMQAGRARVSMPAIADVLDADGSHHPGALAALLDTAGAMASWSLVPPGLHKAMTPGLQMSFLARSEGEEVVALARTVRKHAEIFHNRVDLVGDGGRLLATGLLTYRIVVGEKG